MKPFHELLTRRMQAVFGSWQDEPEPEAFDAFHQRLSAVNQRRRRRLVFFRTGLAAALLLCAFIPFYWYSSQHQPAVITDIPTPPQLSPQMATPPVLDDSLTDQPTLSYEYFPANEQTDQEPQADDPAQTGFTASIFQQTEPLHSERSELSHDLISHELNREPRPDRLSEILLRSELDTFHDIPEADSPVAVLPLQSEFPTTEERIMPEQRSDSKPRIRLQVGSALASVPDNPSTGVGFSAGATHYRNLTNWLQVESGGLLSYTSYQVDRSETFAGRVDSHFAMAGNRQEPITGSVKQQYDLMMVDIPLNLRFLVHEGRSGRFDFTGGLSSLVYLQQTFRDENQQVQQEEFFNTATQENEFRLTEVTSQVTERQGPFSRFEPLQLLNLAVGYHLPDTSNNLSAELFVKYPLRGLTDRRQEITTVGVALRYGL